MKRRLPIAFVAICQWICFASVAAQAPDLASANTYGLFTSIGAIDNIGFSEITGDVGTNAGAFNGFPPAVVFGQIHVADPVSAQVALDVDIAYAAISPMTCGTVLGTGLGGGQILTPDVYCIGAATVLNGDLTFDALGDPNALFYIKIDVALTTGLASRVLLLNSAAQCNIYWQINGAVDFGDNSSFQGIVLANGQLTLLSGATIQGKALTRQGAVSLNANTINSCTPAVLPVTLLDFQAEQADAGTVANLTWQTSSETNSDYFLVERSVDGIQFESIGKQLAAGNSSLLTNYAFTDESPVDGVNYYRLKQIDQNGFSTNSIVLLLSFDQSVTALHIFPNPFNTSLVLHLDRDMKDANFEWHLLDATGKVLIHSELKNEATTVEMTQIPAGFYLYRLTRNGVPVQSGRLIAQH